MTYSLVTNDTIQATGRLPNSARRLDTGEWVMGLATASFELQQACGWFEVVDTVRPADTDTHTHDRTIELVFDVPTVTWTPREWSPEELAANQAAANRATLADPSTLEQRLARLAAYTSDPEIVAALARANNQAPSTQELNRLLKVMLRRDDRQTTAIALLVRLVADLTANIADTTEPA